jgi:hypothetical protein
MPELLAGSRVEHTGPYEVCDQVVAVARTLLPLMQRSGIATPDTLAIDTLAQRMRAEARELDATLVSPTFVGAWTQTARSQRHDYDNSREESVR